MISALLVALLTQAKPASPPAKWETEWRVKGTLGYNTNVFLLDGDHKDRLENDLPADQASGRYDDMESVEDFILTPELRYEVKGPSPIGRRWDAQVGLQAPVYFLNPRRTHLYFGAGAGQSIGRDGHLGLSAGMLPQYFNKNYLADGVDANGDGNISSRERIYEAGVYQEFEVQLEYRHRIVDRSAQQPLGLEGEVAAGYRVRTYDSPFDGRDETAPFVRVGLDISYAFPKGAVKGSGWVLKGGVFYKYEAVDSPTEQEVVLLNEPYYGVDFSGDGDTTDSNARSVQAVDRTRTEHRFGVLLGASIGSSIDLGVEYSRLLKEFDSSNSLDVAHSGRNDTRDDFGLFLKYNFRKGVDVKVGYEWRRQITDRPDDPDSVSESTDYKRNIFYLSFSYRF